jgi:uncharacterized LabA/DUF88 family protein
MGASMSSTPYIPKNGFYAIFVDAGYLYAQGSEVVFNKKTERSLLEIDITKCLAAMEEQFPFKQFINLLRVYWYDGIKGNMLNDEQEKIARTDFVKFRAGTVNSANIQKGVDSLIVTDLIELARNRAITDAVIITGDADLKIGMTIAQSFGVRVHLLGLGEGKASQSSSLLDEVDTLRSLSKVTIESFLTQKSDDYKTFADKHVSTLSLEKTREVLEFIQNKENNGLIPKDINGLLMIEADRRFGKPLSKLEQETLRKRFKAALKNRLALSE